MRHLHLLRRRGPALAWGGIVAIVGAAASAACGDLSNPTVPVSLDITPDTVVLFTTQSRQLTAVVLNAAGAQISGQPISFESASPAIATVSTGGLVTGVAAGTASITARSSNATATATAIVTSDLPATVILAPDSLDLATGTAGFVTPAVFDAAGNRLPDAFATITSSDTSVFRTTGSVVSAIGSGKAKLIATAGSVGDTIPVVVYRPFTRTLQPRAAVPNRPFGVAISSQNVMYVTQQDGDALTRFDLPSLTPGATVSVGNDPGEVIFTANGQTAYTTNVLATDVSMVNVGSGTTTDTFAVGETPFRVRLSSDETRLFVSTPGGNIRILNAATGASLGGVVASAGPANGLALSTDGTRLYVSCTCGTIAEVNTANNAVLRTFTVGGQLQDVALSPNGAELYVANELGSVKTVSVATGTVSDTVALNGGPFGLRVSPDGYYIVVSRAAGGRITVLDRALRRVMREFTVGGTPRRIAFTADGATMAVANEANGVDIIR